MRAGSGSLAIGELLGAASFIVSVVAGSMPLVRPFRVNPGSFVRDVGFFTLAVACILAILIDGQIHAWEAIAMVGLYLVYVCVVVGGSWWDTRRQRLAHHEAVIRGEYAETPIEPEPYRDHGTLSLIAVKSCSVDLCRPNRLSSFAHAQCANPGPFQSCCPACPFVARASDVAYSTRPGFARVFSLGFSIDLIHCPPPSLLLASGRPRVPLCRQLAPRLFCCWLAKRL